MSDMSSIVQEALQRSVSDAQNEAIRSILSRYSSLHLRVLKFAKDPTGGQPQRGSSFGSSSKHQVMMQAFRGEDGRIVEDVYANLQADHLVSESEIKKMSTTDGAYAPSITPFGAALLQIVDQHRAA